MKEYHQKWDAIKGNARRVNWWLEILSQVKYELSDNLLMAVRPILVPNMELYNRVTEFANQDESHTIWIDNLLMERESEDFSQIQDAVGIVEGFVHLPDQYSVPMARAYLVELGLIDRLTVVAMDPDTPEDVRTVVDHIVSDMQWREQGYMTLTNMVTVNAERAGAEEMFTRLDALLDHVQ